MRSYADRWIKNPWRSARDLALATVLMTLFWLMVYVVARQAALDVAMQLRH
jgi:hypothetical protein